MSEGDRPNKNRKSQCEGISALLISGIAREMTGLDHPGCWVLGMPTEPYLSRSPCGIWQPKGPLACLFIWMATNRSLPGAIGSGMMMHQCHCVTAKLLLSVASCTCLPGPGRSGSATASNTHFSACWTRVVGCTVGCVTPSLWEGGETYQ